MGAVTCEKNQPMQANNNRFKTALPDDRWSERLFMLSPALLCIAGTDGYFKRVNPAFHAKLGHTEAVLLSRPFIEFVHPDDRQSTLDEVGKLATGIPAVHFENRYRHADGSYRWLLWNTTPVEEELLYAAAIDITERKHADEQYRHLLNAIPDAIIVTDEQGRIIRINQATESMFGYAPEELLGQSIDVLLPPRFHDQHRQHRNEYMTAPKSQLMGARLTDLAAVRKGGSEFPAEITLGPAGLHDRVVICTARDISERSWRERELEESRRGLVEDQRQIQGLLTRLVLAEERERRRIARGLHDDVGHTLLAAKLVLEELSESDMPANAASSAEEVRRLVSQAIETTRSLSFALASAALYEVGVGAALQSECEIAQQRSGIRFHAPEELSGEPIPVETKVILHRVGRELIRNIERHSNARTAKLSLSLSAADLRMTVEDDGRGFDVPKDFLRSNSLSGFGLFSIDQQLDSIGGRLDITSSPESGTRAIVTVPLHARREGR